MPFQGSVPEGEQTNEKKLHRGRQDKTQKRKTTEKTTKNLMAILLTAILNFVHGVCLPNILLQI